MGCSKYFKISPDETLRIAQELYEKKMVTYPRTDARVLSTAGSTSPSRIPLKGHFQVSFLYEHLKACKKPLLAADLRLRLGEEYLEAQCLQLVGTCPAVGLVRQNDAS